MTYRPSRLLPALLLALALAGPPACDEATPAADAADAAPDAAGDSGAADTAQDATPEVEVDTGPPPPPGRAARGLTELRAIAHLHSAYSHDACDELFEETGEVPTECVNRLKSALCEEQIAVAFMTDHPSHMTDQSFRDLTYADEAAGDIVLSDDDGNPWGAAFACEGEGGAANGRALLVVGYETRHTMPLGIRRHLSDPAMYSTIFADDTPTEALSAVTAEVRAAGGRVAIAHSEEDDISWHTLAAHDVSAMELYNFHANFNQVLETGDLLQALEDLDAFMGSEPDAPPADLAGLVMLDNFPVAALEKWRRVSVERSITAFAGSDVHENVIVPAICVGGLCDDLAVDAPHVARALTVGGPLIMGDGDRIDSYGRIFRWVQNRVLVDADADPLAAVEAGIEAGRNVVVFELLGDAQGVDFVAERADGTIAELGSTVAAGSVLWVRSPEVPVPGRNATWTDGSAAVMASTLLRTTADGSEVVLEWAQPGTWQRIEAPAEGSYHLEVMLTPEHLRSVLGSRAELAANQVRWVETNAIRVEAAASSPP